MQENNIIYEIAEKIQDKNIMQNDFKEAMFLVSNMFREKYVDKLQNELVTNVNNIKANPTKEINLLRAIKPFVNEDNKKNLEDIIDMMTNISAVNFMMPKTTPKKNNIIKINNINIKDSSVKEDGVYDIDESCLFGVKNKGDNNNILNIILGIFLIQLLKR